MPEFERNYSREKYRVEHDMLEYYRGILEARMMCANTLNQYRGVQNGLSTDDLEEEMQNRKDTEEMFKHYLDLYFDLVRYKFQKADKTDKPEFTEEMDSVYGIEMENAIKLYHRCNELLEELEITSMENLDKGRRQI